MAGRVSWVFLLFFAAWRGVAQSPPASPTYKDFEPKPVVLSAAELDRLKTAVMSRCHMAQGTDLTKAPWYFQYELGLELEKRRDPQRALDAFIEAVQHRPDPKRGARMYGIWFINYLPYFEIAKAHAALGNWQCAADAVRMSLDTGELSAEDWEYAELLEIRAEAEKARKP